MDLDQALHHYFGFDQFHPGQREVMTYLLEGRSAAAVFPTGGGKSLCYQLPALLLPGVTLVISPLIALMKDQIDALAARGIAARRLDSSLSLDEYRAVIDGVRGGEVRLLYVAPERFNNERFRNTMQGIRVGLFAVDEAHCISEWGHNFRPDYLKLAGYAKQLGAERILGLTATATPRVLEDMCRVFEIEPECAIKTGFYRKNLTLHLDPVEGSERDISLSHTIAESEPGATIVYVTRQRTAEELAEQLASSGLPARAYHAGMSSELRGEVQDWFLQASDGIVVATIAFGMGIDKPDIRYVYHYNLPKSLENYSQEIGRAGRDGKPSVCRLFATTDDLPVLENFILGDTPTESAIRSLVGELFAPDESNDLSLSLTTLSRAHDIRELVLKTILTYLELDGYLEGGTPIYSGYKFIPQKSSGEILALFPESKHEFLLSIFRCAKKGRTWFSIDTDDAARASQSPRTRVIAALEHLAERELIELKAEGVRNRYRRLRLPDDPNELAEEISMKMESREESELVRLHQVLDLVTLDRCQVGALCEYFGEQLPGPCGHCSYCLHGVRPLPSSTVNPVNPDIVAEGVSLGGEYEFLREPVPLTRFLCGLSSPRITKERLSRHPRFGALEEVPFSAVRHAVAEALTTEV